MKLKQFSEKEIQHQMQCNHCTREEALDILAWDYDIDHGDKEKGAPTAEQKKLIRSLTKADKAPTEKRAVKRERKVDADKLAIIQVLDDALCDIADNVEERKNETDIHFTYNGCEYTVKLTKHRAPKG